MYVSVITSFLVICIAATRVSADFFDAKTIPEFTRVAKDRRKFEGGAEWMLPAAPGGSRQQAKFFRPYRDRRLFEGGSYATGGGQTARFTSGDAGPKAIIAPVKAPVRPALAGVRFQRPMRSEDGTVDEGVAIVNVGTEDQAAAAE